MSHQGEPGRPGQPGEPGTAGGGHGGSGGAGGHGGAGDTTITRGARRAAVTLLLISFAIGGANLLFTAREVNNTRAAAASVTQLCELGNESRAQQIVLWEHIIAISPPPPHETPAQARQRLATVRAFDAYLHKVFAPRDCHAITH